MEFNKEEIKREIDPLGILWLKNALTRLGHTEYCSANYQVQKQMTDSEKKEYEAIISAFDQKRREMAINELYMAAKNFVALHETRD